MAESSLTLGLNLQAAEAEIRRLAAESIRAGRELLAQATVGGGSEAQARDFGTQLAQE